MLIPICVYILMAIVTFVALTKYQQKTANHDDDVVIVAHLILSVLWVFYLPMLVVFLIAKSFVKLITGGVK